MTRRRRWLTIGLPVVLLLIKAGNYGVAAFGPGPHAIGDFVTTAAVLGVLSLVAAAALLAGHRIGWILALTFIGWDLGVLLVLWWIGQPDYLAMGLAALAAGLLTSPEMRALHDPAEDAA
ncbi:MAG: hypothetical protein IT341_02765 [Chloroflexi bacterium]|nr:hypothetical protein [Chloroflexota bacterium]